MAKFKFELDKIANQESKESLEEDNNFIIQDEKKSNIIPYKAFEELKQHYLNIFHNSPSEQEREWK